MPDLTVPWDEVRAVKKAMERHIIRHGVTEICHLDPKVSMIAVKVAADQFCREHGCVLEETKLGISDPYVKFGAH